MRNVSNIYVHFLFVNFCWYYYDVSFVQLYLKSEVLVNLLMLGRCKGQAKTCNKKVTAQHA